MTGESTCAFQDFIGDLELLTSAGFGLEPMIRGISAKLRLLLDGGGFLSREQREPDPAGYADHPIYSDPRQRFVVKSGVWLPGQGTPIHDHGTWGLMGVVTGELKISRFRRIDDRLRPGHARLGDPTVLWAGPGAVTEVLPPDEEIHKVECIDRPALSIHVYGRDIVECTMYDPETETCRPFETEHEDAGQIR